jgi:hypothetical protein
MQRISRKEREGFLAKNAKFHAKNAKFSRKERKVSRKERKGFLAKSAKLNRKGLASFAPSSRALREKKVLI